MLKINIHEVLAVLLIGLLLYVCNIYHWDVSWFYVLPAITFYVGAIIGLSYTPPHELPPIPNFQMTMGTHLAFALLTGGLYINQSGLLVNMAIFVGSIVVGMAMPFMVFREVK